MTLKCGSSAKARGYFEVEAEFSGDGAEEIVGAYERAARRAGIAAKTAVSCGGLANMREAQWWEAVTETLEAVLSARFLVEDEKRNLEVDLPLPPEFT